MSERSGSRREAMPSSRLERWVRRLDRTSEAIEWFVRKVVVAGLLVLLGIGLAWYSALEYLTPDPWSGPNAMTDTFGWQVWAAGAAAITGLVGLCLIEYIQYALVTPVAVASWILARFRPDDPVRRTVTGLPEQARAFSGRAHAVSGRARAVSGRAREALARPTYTRADIIAPLRAAVRRPGTWLLAAGGIVLAVVLVVGVATLLAPVGGGPAKRPPLTAAEIAAAEEHFRAVAMEIHAVIGSPPIREDLRLVERPRCVPGNQVSGRYPSGFAYLSTRPGADPVGRMPGWADELRAGGWAVTYPIETRGRPVKGLLVATRAGVEVTLDARYAPDLSIEVRGLC